MFLPILRSCQSQGFTSCQFSVLQCLPLPQELQAVCWHLAALCAREGIPLSSAVSKILRVPADSGPGLGELGERGFMESSAVG